MKIALPASMAGREFVDVLGGVAVRREGGVLKLTVAPLSGAVLIAQ